MNKKPIIKWGNNKIKHVSSEMLTWHLAICFLFYKIRKVRAISDSACLSTDGSLTFANRHFMLQFFWHCGLLANSGKPENGQTMAGWPAGLSLMSGTFSMLIWRPVLSCRQREKTNRFESIITSISVNASIAVHSIISSSERTEAQIVWIMVGRAKPNSNDQ